MKLSPEEILLKAISANSDLTPYVGDRIFPDVAPAGTPDGWVVYQRVGSSNDANSHDGFDDLTEPVYQVTFWTTDARKRRKVRELMFTVFRMKRIDIEGTDVVLSKVDDRDLSEDGPPRLYGASLDISVSL